MENITVFEKVLETPSNVLEDFHRFDEFDDVNVEDESEYLFVVKALIAMAEADRKWVKITKSTSPISWYAGFIGQVFEVEKTLDGLGYSLHKGQHLIRIDDSEVVGTGSEE